MSLINCPSCQNKISNKVEVCPNCEFSFNDTADDLIRAKTLLYRKYRDKMYQFKMLTYTAMAIAVVGLVPMLWTYAKAIDYGFNASLLNHWGINFIIFGFILYVVVRVMMFTTKRNYKLRK